jgi:hypothetical protein
MKRILKLYNLLLLILVFGILPFSSCVKTRPGETDFSGLKAIVQIPEGGLANFGSSALNFPGSDAADTINFHLNYAATRVAPKDVVVTIGYDSNALSAYNSTSGSAPYSKFPDSIYSFTTTQVTIKAGQSYSAGVPFVVFPNKIDPSQNYMFPISITDAQGNNISSNFGTYYIHLIGNPLAGTYNVVGTRYNYVGQVSWTGPPAAIPASYVSTTNLSTLSPKVAAPDNSQTVEMGFSNLGSAGYNYVITGSADFSSIAVDYNFDAIYSNIVTYIVSYTPPSPTQKPAFHIMTHYNNALGGAGNDRIIDETFTHQ